MRLIEVGLRALRIEVADQAAGWILAFDPGSERILHDHSPGSMA